MVAVVAEQPVDHIPGVAGLGQDKRVLGHLFDRNAAMLRQRMSLGSHHLDFVTENANHFHAAPGVRQRDDAQLNLAFLNFLQNLVAEIPIDADLDQRVKLLEPRKRLGKDVQAGRLVGPDVQLAARRLV